MTSLLTFATSRVPQLVLARWGLVCLIYVLIGCPSSSEWDREWAHMHTMLAQGQIKEAKDLLHHMLSSAQQKGPTESRYALIIFQLGEIARLEGHTHQAEAYYWEALPLFAQSLGPEHLRMADPLEALASLYHHKGQTEMALPLKKRALAIREKFIGFSDPQLLPTLRSYHDLLLAADRQEEAKEISDRVARILKSLP